MTLETTCTTERGCNGTNCIGIADADDQIDQILNQGNPHQVTRAGVESWLQRKKDNILPICLQQAALRARLKLAKEQTKHLP